MMKLKACGNYYVCVNISMNEQVKLFCSCKEDYTLYLGLCVPNICDRYVCAKGKCILDPDSILLEGHVHAL